MSTRLSSRLFPTVRSRIFHDTATSIVLCLLCGLLLPAAYGQQAREAPRNYFRNPLLIAPSLAGNFGDLRANHYHMGLDFRTAQQENLPVVAAADGYVSHIRIEPYGYGRAIFITHPNGYTTLYAHLNAFFPELEQWVTDRQYATQSWQQDIDFTPAQFPVHKGQFIARSGNTGGSQGPHLHFEIRDSGLEQGRNHNPLLFGLGIADQVAPVLYRLAIFDRRQSIYENGPLSFNLQQKQQQGESFYTTATPLIKVPAGRFSFGLSMEDKTNNSFLFGIYEAALYVDDSLRNLFSMRQGIYEDSRYINAGIDYYTRYNGGGYLQHLSRLPGNHSPYFDPAAGDGVLELTDDSIHQVVVEVTDVAGNLSRLRFAIRRNDLVSFPANGTGTVVKQLEPNQAADFGNRELQLVLDEKALYDTVLLRYQVSAGTYPEVSARHSIGDYRLPVHDSFTLRIRPTGNLPDSIRRKTVMVIRSGRKYDAQVCTWNAGWAAAKWWNFGQFFLKYDQVPPSLRTVNVYDSALFVKDRKLVFEAADETGDLSFFSGYIDDQWVPFRQKDNRYTYDFDRYCPPGWHRLLVKARDLAGNETVYECRFRNGGAE